MHPEGNRNWFTVKVVTDFTNCVTTLAVQQQTMFAKLDQAVLNGDMFANPTSHQ